jgi:ligand-binding sensor domain-containing protein/AraC-like DNA-binding protein
MKHCGKYWFTAFIILTNTLFCIAQNASIKTIEQAQNNSDVDFYHLRTDGGMEQNSVNWITQDYQGRIWYSTKDGLVKYDAKEFSRYKFDADDPHSITNNFVHQVIDCLDSSIWVAAKGLSRYRPGTDDFETILTGNYEIIRAGMDSRGLLWSIDESGILYRYDGDEVHSFESDIEPIHGNTRQFRDFLITKDDRIFILTNQPRFLEFDSKTLTFNAIQFLSDDMWKSFPGKPFFANRFTEDHNGDIWMGSLYGFLVQYDPDTGDFTYHYFQDKDSKRTQTIMFLTEDSDHNLWFGTWGYGLYQLSPDRKLYRNYLPNEQNRASLSNTIITSAYQDMAGYLWFGTEFTGINILKKNKKFSVLAYDPDVSLTLPPFPYLDAAVDNSDRVWIATDGGGSKTTISGLYYFNKDDEIPHHTGTSIIGDEIRVFSLLYGRDGFLWIGTGNGLFKYHPDNRAVKHYPCKYNNDYNSPGGNNIISLCEDNNGNIWMGAIHGGLTRFDVENDKFYRFMPDEHNPNSLSYKHVSAINCDSNGDIWAGTLDGLNKFNPETGDFTVFKTQSSESNALSSSVISCLYKSDGILWIGTQGGGLNQYDLKTKKFSSFQTKDGLPDNNVRAINTDDHGNLWISTTHNISRFNPQTREIITYTGSDGLSNQMTIEGYGSQKLEFNEEFGRKDADGYLYFGGLGGMVFFHPDSLPVNDFEAPIRIDQLLVNGDDYNIPENQEITLEPNENSLEFTLTLLNYIQPDKNQYAHYLENYDSSWISDGVDHHIEYFDLPKGEYALHYKAANNDGIWSETSKPLVITIKPRFYQTPIFYILLAGLVLLIGVAFAAYKYRIKKQLKKERELQKYTSSTLSDKEVQEISERLAKTMTTDQLYLHADLTLYKLAEVLDTKPHSLSQVLNQYHQSGFHAFINKYRIEEAKKMLIETDLKIIAVAYDCGFKSISTFNVAFKKETGMTPSQFRKRQS